jgi:indolepyruvate ferredoxin oxidoreductase beta subunit
MCALNFNINKNILICGIGGQGVVLAGRIISLAAFESGLDVKTSEVHGMSQRGGSVSTHVRFGEKIFSPLISENKADIILSFDIYETARYAGSFANEKTVVISSDYGKLPSCAPENKGGLRIVGLLKTRFQTLRLISDKKIAEDLGNAKVSNIFAIGLLSNFTGIKEKTWIKVIGENVPEKTADINLKAFLTGRGEL